MNTPKPTPPRMNLKDLAGKVETNFEADEYVFKSGQTVSKELPPINLKSPDGTRVLSVTDPAKAQSMVKKGWAITDDKKTPYVPAEHLTNKPFQEGLADLKRQMDKTERSSTYGLKPPPKRRPPYRKIKKENN